MSQSDNKDKAAGETDKIASDGETSTDAEVVTTPAAAPPQPEPAYAGGADEIDDHHSGGSTLSGMALRFLIIILVVFGLSLWLVPMVAPHLPTSIAKHIMPGQKELDTRLAALDKDVRGRTDSAIESVKKLEDQIAELTKRLAAAEEKAAKAQAEAAAAKSEAEKSAKAASTATVAEDVVTKAEGAAAAAAEAADTATTAATEAGKVAAAATRDAASLARRMTSFEARVAGISQEFSAMREALAKAPAGEGGAASPELAAAFAALQSQVDGLAKQMTVGTDFLKAEDADRFATQDDLRSARTALQAELKAGLAAVPSAPTLAKSADLAALKKAVDTSLTEMGTRIEAAEENAKTAAKAANAAADATSKATGKVETAIRSASVRSAVAALSSRLANGVPFADALTELEKLTETKAPAALSDAAKTGVPTAADLRRTFGRQAQAAISADIRDGAKDDGLFGKAAARLESVVAGRPKGETEGDDAAAIISRVEARLRDGALAQALAEANDLPDAAKAVLSDWMGKLVSRIAADAAASSYIQELTRQQG